MKTLLKTILKLVLLAALTELGFGQTAATDKTVAEVAVTYSALRTNSPVGGCGCFWASGGAIEVALPVWRDLSAVAEFSGETASSIPNHSGIGLSLISGLGGLRFSHLLGQRLVPFAQGLFGFVHAFNGDFPTSAGSNTSASSFALAAGGGLDVGLTQGLMVRPVQVDYQYMQLPNGSTNEQHDIRISAGIIFRFPH